MYPHLTDMGTHTRYQPYAAGLYLWACAALLLLYVIAWRIATHLSFSQVRWPLWSSAVLCGVINVFMYPAWAIDVYNYLFQGRMWAKYGSNPLVVAPSAFPQDPLMRLTGGWADQTAPYGPLWVMLSALPNWLAGDNLLANLLLFKLLALLSYLGCGALIVLMLGRSTPQYQAAGFVLFAWNPLALLEVPGHGHNDATMMMFMLGAMLLLYSSSRLASPAAFALSILTKYTTIILFPLFLIRLSLVEPRWKGRLWILGGGLGIAAVLVTLIFGPLWGGREIYDALARRNSVCIASAGALINLACDQNILPAIPQFLPAVVPIVILGTAYLLALFAIRRRPDIWLRASFEIAFLLVYLLCSFENWYLVWPLALVALLSPGLASWRMIVFTGTAMLGTAIFGYLWVWNMPAWGMLEVHLVAVPVVLGPPAVLAVWEWSQWLRGAWQDKVGKSSRRDETCRMDG
jgi:alpha-1,6-mannosyltransferase